MVATLVLVWVSINAIFVEHCMSFDVFLSYCQIAGMCCDIYTYMCTVLCVTMCIDTCAYFLMYNSGYLDRYVYQNLHIHMC